MNSTSRILRIIVIAVFIAASAFGSVLPGTTKVVIPIGTHLSNQYFTSVGAERVQDYDAFRVYRVPSAALAKLQAAAAAVGEVIEVHDEWDTVLFRNRSIDTRIVGAANVAIDSAGTNALQLYVVQFSSPPTLLDEQLLANAGAYDLGYIPNNAVLVAAHGRALAAALASASRVQWVAAYDRSLKPSLPGTPLAADEFVVQFANTPETMPHIQEFLSSHQALQVSSYLQYTNVRVRLTLSEASAAMDDPDVVVVEPAGRSLLSGEREAISTTTPFSTSTVYQTSGQPFRLGTPDYRNWLPPALVTAAGSYRVAIADSGVDRGACAGTRHPDLLNTMSTQDYTGGCGSDQLGHGTMVAGFAVANPTTGATDSAGTNGTFNYAMGTAPPAQIFNQRIFDQNGAIATTPGGVLTWANDAYLNGSVAQNHSHNDYFPGAGNDGAYTTTAQAYDQAVRDTYSGDSVDTPMTIVVSAGNICGGSANYTTGDCSSRVLSPGTAKNVITVGAAESYRPGKGPNCQFVGVNRQPGDFLADSFDNVAYISRRATLDNRIKPDVIAPATMVASTRSQASANNFCFADPTNMYYIDTGTSFAAPQVTGAAALLDAKFGVTYSPAMLKAALIGTAKSVKGGLDRYTNTTMGARPNYNQGWGRLSLDDIIQGRTAYRLLDENSFTPFTAALQARSGTFTVADPAKPVVIVLAWTDEPASVPAGTTLVRDLDLQVHSGCTLYSGNYMNSSEVSVAQNYCYGPYVRDSTNNVEMVVVPAGTLSTLSYSISVHSWFGSHNQKFALFASNVF
jgi:Subtilase family